MEASEATVIPFEDSAFREFGAEMFDFNWYLRQYNILTESIPETQIADVGVGGSVPEGTIVPWIGGHFTDGSNAGYTRILGADNTVVEVNSLLNSEGWYVCDGAALDLGTSTIFSGTNRYLPNLTDDRFIMGDNAAGGSGGSNTMAHTHGIGSYAAANESAHTHAKGSIATGNESAHTHGAGSYAAGSHYHVTTISAIGASNLIYTCDEWGQTSEALSSHTRFTCVSHTDHGAASVTLFNTKSTTPSFSGTSAAGSAHNHSTSGSTAAGSAHTHTLSGTSAAASNTENRPKFLSTFFIIYVLA